MSTSVTEAATLNDGRKQHRRTKSNTRKRRRRWPLSLAVGTLALLLAVPLTMYVWQTAQATLPARLKEPPLPATHEIEGMREIPPSDEDSSKAPAPSAVLYPADMPYPVISDEEIPRQFKQPHIRRMRARLQYLKGTLVVFQKRSMTAVYQPHPVENSVVLLLGNSALATGSLGVNSTVEQALLGEARRHSLFISKLRFREMLSALHRYALSIALEAPRGRLVTISEKTFTPRAPTESTCTFVPRDEPQWDTDEVDDTASLVFLHKLKWQFTPYGHKFNRFLLYLVPPNPEAPDEDYFKAYRRAILNAVLLINAYNKKNEDEPLTRILVPPLWPTTAHQRYRSHILALDCLKTLRYAAEKGLIPGITIEFLADQENQFITAARELEERYHSTWWS